MRLNKFIAANSSYSRRKADELITAGRIFINGKKVTTLGINVDETKDIVEIDRQKIKVKNEKIYIALNKPRGFVCTRNDEKNRPTVLDLVPKNQNLKPVGRLDFETEGLLLLTNDGEFINRVIHPRFACEKEYYVEIDGIFPEKRRIDLENGVFLEGKKTAPAEIKILKATPKMTTLTIKLHEGRKRQIRKMFALKRSPVAYLQRIRIGVIHLASLPKGKFRYLTSEEINAFKSN